MAESSSGECCRIRLDWYRSSSRSCFSRSATYARYATMTMAMGTTSSTIERGSTHSTVTASSARLVFARATIRLNWSISGSF